MTSRCHEGYFGISVENKLHETTLKCSGPFKHRKSLASDINSDDLFIVCLTVPIIKMIKYSLFMSNLFGIISNFTCIMH